MKKRNRRRRARNAVLAVLAAQLGAAVFAVDAPEGRPAKTSWLASSLAQELSSPRGLGAVDQAAAARDAGTPVLKTIEMPAAYVSKVSTALELRYRDSDEIQVSPDIRSGRLVILAPEAMQRQIRAEAMQIFVSESRPKENDQGVDQASAVGTAAALAAGVRTAEGSLQMRLATIGWQQFEDSLQRVAGKRVPVTTSRNGERALFQLTGAPLDGTTIEIDRRENLVTVVAPEPAMPGWQKMIRSIDRSPNRPDEVIEMIRVENAKPAPIQRAMRLLDSVSDDSSTTVVPAGPAGLQTTAFQPPQDQPPPAAADEDAAEAGEEAAGMIGDTQIQFVPELGIIIVRGAKRDTQRVLDVIRQIEDQSVLTQPEVEIYPLKHLNDAAAAELLNEVYEEVLAARQGEVTIKALDHPNALLLIGRREAVANALALVEKLDQPLAASSRLQVFRLNHASATDAEATVRSFFVERPGSVEEPRPGLGARVRILADYRTNSLIVGASPRDLAEVSSLIRKLDVESIPAQNEIKVFSLRNSLAEDLAPVLQAAINGEGEGTPTDNENATRASTALSIVSLDAENGGVLNSGILSGLVVTADANANAVIVRGPSSSMSLIAELIRQLDQVPGVESLVKVFTIENGDAMKLSTSLQELFAQATGQGAGQGNLGQLAPATASSSSLVNLRFSTDQRTNSIIATGSASDLEVVESILLRLDTSGFAERITEVIWLRHQSAPEIAAAIQQYVQQRTQTVNTIQQFQQGLGPFDLPDRDLVVVAEAVSNSLLLSVSPRLYQDVRRLIESLDRRPPMVLIKVVLAEVRLGDQFELGGELGLQDSLLFDRGRALPANTPNSVPGFNFNNNGTPNVGVVNPGTVGSRALSTFGLGATSQATGYGGFVLSAASDSFSLLLRALQDANRAQILSRPSIMTVDNKAGFVNVGQLVSRVNGLSQGSLGTPPILSAADIEVGLTLEVLPRVGADGLISMQILARRSEVDRTAGTGTPIGTDLNGAPIIVPDINETRAESTIVAYSGQTVIFGGLIQKQRTNESRKVPYLGDIPLLGVMFRFDRETETRNELLIIMTPMLVNGDEDLEYVKQVESSRMSYCLADVVEMHGDVGLSGGYGLWGPAIGPTIYPDMHPTVDQFPQAAEGEVEGEGEVIYEEPSLLQSPSGYEADPNRSRMPGTGPMPSQPGTRGDVPLQNPEALPSSPPQPGYPSQAAFRPSTGSPTANRGGNPNAAGREAGQLPGRAIRPADFKFIDQEAATQLSGFNQ